MIVEEKTLVCLVCTKPFLFSKAEQTFFNDKGFTNLPKRCANCLAYQEIPPRVQYSLTDRGCDLIYVLEALKDLGESWQKSSKTGVFENSETAVYKDAFENG